MCREQRRVPRRQSETDADVFRQMVGELCGELLQRLVDEPPLHLRRDAARLLVHGDDPAGVNRLPFLIVQNLVLRIRQLQTRGAAHFDRPVQHDRLPAHEDVLQERLIEPHDSQRSGAVVDDRFEDLEAGTAGGAKTAGEQTAGDRRGLPRFQRRDRLEVTAIFVTGRKPVKQIFDRDEAGMLEVRGTPGADAFQELQRRRKHIVGGHCTIIAWPRSTWISRILAGSSNGSSRPIPDGFSRVRE